MRIRFWPALFFLAVLSSAQTARTGAPVKISTLQVPQPMLRRMIRNSGRIFAGTVTNIQFVQDGIPITRVTFRIDEAIRGVRKDQTIQMSEWGALWQAGERYRTGQRVLLFLYPESKLGLTSPVAGAMGRWSIERDGTVETGAAVTRFHKFELKDIAAALRRAAHE